MTNSSGTGHINASTSADAGFTLIELVIALAIMILVTAVAMPALDRARNNTALDRAAAAIIAELDGARTTALRTNAPQEIVLNLARAGLATAQPSTFTFRPDGSGQGGPLTLASGTRRITIALDPLTGLARHHASP